MSKIFIYTDAEYDFDKENVFLSTTYKDLPHFRKENPDLSPVLSYSVDDVIPELKQLKEENARLREALESILELNILGNDNQGKMAFIARKALERGE